MSIPGRASIARRLPLSVAGIVVVVTAIMTTLAYLEVRRGLVAAASERLDRVTAQLQGLLEQSSRQAYAALTRVAQSDSVLAYLAAPSAARTAAMHESLVRYSRGGSTRALELWRSPSSKLMSNPGESEGEFRVRLAESSREKRDELKERVRERYGAKLATLQERLKRAEERVEREKGQASAQKMQAAISMGSTILGALFGRKRLSTATLGRATTAARGVGRAMREGDDVDRAQDSVEGVTQQITQLTAEMEEQVTAQESATDPRQEALETVSIKPKKADIEPRLVTLVWAPYVDATPAWE